MKPPNRLPDQDEAAPEREPPPHPLYQPEDDTYCWLCRSPVAKLHCKIVCRNCGFTRDCSDP